MYIYTYIYIYVYIYICIYLIYLYIYIYVYASSPVKSGAASKVRGIHIYTHAKSVNENFNVYHDNLLYKDIYMCIFILQVYIFI
jgi:hypothetical protein